MYNDKELIAATRSAKERTNKLIGVSVEAGRYRVEHIIPKGNTSEVIPLSEDGSLEDAISFLKAM